MQLRYTYGPVTVPTLPVAVRYRTYCYLIRLKMPQFLVWFFRRLTVTALQIWRHPDNGDKMKRDPQRSQNGLTWSLTLLVESGLVCTTTWVGWSLRLAPTPLVRPAPTSPASPLLLLLLETTAILRFISCIKKLTDWCMCSVPPTLKTKNVAIAQFFLEKYSLGIFLYFTGHLTWMPPRPMLEMILTDGWDILTGAAPEEGVTVTPTGKAFMMGVTRTWDT